MDADHSQLPFWLRLAGAPGLGPMVARRLACALGGPQALLATPLSELRKLGARDGILRALSCIRAGDEEPALRWRDSAAVHHVLCIDDPAYPPMLASLADAPVALLVLGSPQALSLPSLAIVGSRNPSAMGVDVADAFAFSLSRVGLAIISGLARGVDAAAHRGALRAVSPTLAVLGHGPDIVYPRQHQALARDIVAGGGALITEFMPGVSPRPGHFPRRNRIISGLSRGVLVVEAALRSGSLSTARSALDQGREVFAVPGSIHNPMARGCHWLIRQGAKLVETTEDVLEELRFECASPTPSGADTASARGADTGLDDDYVTVLDALAFDPVAVDTLVQRTGLTPQVLSSMLLNLQLKGLVSPVSGGRYVRRREG